MRNLSLVLLLSLLVVCPLAVSAATTLTGNDLLNAAAERRTARIGTQTSTEEIQKEPTSTDRAALIRRPYSTAPLNTSESREAAREAARLKLEALRKAQASQSTQVKDTTVDPVDIPALKEQVFTLTNAERKKEGLAPFRRNSLLDISAQAHAVDMQRRSFFSHTNPSDEEPTDRIKKTGYLDISAEDCDCIGWRYAVGENIAKGQQTPEEVVRDWMASPPHRAAILSSEYTEIGIGIIGDLWAQNFGTIKIKRR